MTTTKLESNRIVYIDQLKGISMFLVVLGHVIWFSLELPESLLLKFIASFHVSIFMFLSGYMAYKSTKTSWLSYLRKKIRTLIFPFIFIGGLYTLCYHESLINDLLFGKMKNGYWFIFVLFEIFILFAPFSHISQIINKSGKLFIDIIIFGTASIIIQSIFIFHIFPDYIFNFCMWNIVTKNFQLFLLGYLCHKYFKLDKLLQTNYVFTLSFVLFIIFFILREKYYILSNLLCAIFGTFSAVYLCKKYTEVLPFGKTWAYMGKLSLDIYVLHYFFIMNISQLRFLFIDNENISLLILISSLSTILIIFLSISVSKIINSSSILSYLMLGKNYIYQK